METTIRPTQDGKPIYRIPEGNVESLEKRVEKLNRRAKKLGVDPLALALIGEAFETRTKRIEDEETGRVKTIEYQVRLVLATLTGSCPRVNGWTFAATINHEEAGNILRTSPEFEGNLPLRYRHATTECEHCAMNRRRNDTYVLVSESGEWKQVGRNCLADFLRTADPNGLAQWAEVVAGLSDEIEFFEDSDFEGGLRAKRYFQTATLLTQVACCVRNDGWCSRGEARQSFEPKTASVDQALLWFDDEYVQRQSAARRAAYEPTEEDRAAALAAIEWAQGIDAGDASGNAAVWFASSPSIPLELDKPMLLKATVKDHSTYNDKKQTVLTRVALHVEKPKKARKMPPLCSGDSLQSGAVLSAVLKGYAAQPLQNATTLK